MRRCRVTVRRVATPIILALVLTTACWGAAGGEPKHSAAGSGNAQDSQKVAVTKGATAASPRQSSPSKADPRENQEIQVLKQLLAAQQQQIEQLRVALKEQRRMIEQALNPGERAAQSNPGLGKVASVNPVIPADQGTILASAGALPVRPTSVPQNEGLPNATPSDLAMVKGELAAVAESVAQTNLRVTKLDEEGRTSLLAGWTGSHPYIRSRDGNFEMEFGGRLQMDFRAYTGTTTPPSSFFIRRARLEAGGQLFKHYEYKVQADFADTGSTLLRDGYINVNYNKGAQFQFGQFKAPFSQEELQSSKYIDFVERSSVNNLAPGHTPGLMLHGELLDGAIEYYAGAFNGRRELAANTSSTPEGYVRLRFTPLRGFSFGGAFADGRHRADNSFLGCTASRSITFFSATPSTGKLFGPMASSGGNSGTSPCAANTTRPTSRARGLVPEEATCPGSSEKGWWCKPLIC